MMMSCTLPIMPYHTEELQKLQSQHGLTFVTKAFYLYSAGFIVLLGILQSLVMWFSKNNKVLKLGKYQAAFFCIWFKAIQKRRIPQTMLLKHAKNLPKMCLHGAIYLRSDFYFLFIMLASEWCICQQKYNSIPFLNRRTNPSLLYFSNKGLILEVLLFQIKNWQHTMENASNRTDNKSNSWVFRCVNLIVLQLHW